MAQKSELDESAFYAGQHWITSGNFDKAGISNARGTTYGFSKWSSGLKPGSEKRYGTTKTSLLKSFKEGVASGRRLEKQAYKKNPSISSTASLIGAKIAKVLKNAKGQIVGVVAHVEKGLGTKRKAASKKTATKRRNPGMYVVRAFDGGWALYLDGTRTTGALSSQASAERMADALNNRKPAKKAVRRNPKSNITAVEVGKNRSGQYITRLKSGSKTVEILGGSSYRSDEMGFARDMAERYGVPLKTTAKDRKY